MSKMVNIKFDKDKCVKCGLCSKICSSHLIKKDVDAFPVVDEGSIQNCMKCQHCYSICPTGAVEFNGCKPMMDAPEIVIPDSKEMLNLIQFRRSCRNYKDENVSKDIIEKLKDMTAWVPTGCNAHSLSFSFIEDKDEMKKFKLLLDSEVSKMSSKLGIVFSMFKQKGFISNLKRFIKYKDMFSTGEDVIFRNAPHMVVVSVDENAPCSSVDPIIALSYFELYAQTLGLGTLWCGLAKWGFDSAPELEKVLNLPENHKISYVMLFGYPDEKFQRITNPDKCIINEIKINS